MRGGIPHQFRALGRKPKSESGDGMNKVEREYAGMLQVRKMAGELAHWSFEPIKIRLADRTFYTPDFLVVLAAGDLELHEVKGGLVMDDARVKFKVCAEHFPARLVWAQKVKKEWKVEVME
jgi:hypothetical protein